MTSAEHSQYPFYIAGVWESGLYLAVQWPTGQLVNNVFRTADLLPLESILENPTVLSIVVSSPVATYYDSIQARDFYRASTRNRVRQ